MNGPISTTQHRASKGAQPVVALLMLVCLLSLGLTQPIRAEANLSATPDPSATKTEKAAEPVAATPTVHRDEFEVGTLALLAMGLIALGLARRRARD